MQTFQQVSEIQLQQLAETTAQNLSQPFVICLWGDLGAGKTTFCRALIRSLCPHIAEVPSPTFTIIQEYASSRGHIWHCDLYRLKDPCEVEELGLIDAFHDKICLIEWPERLGYLLPHNRLDIRLTIAANLTRSINIQCQGDIKIDLNCSK